MRRFIFGKIDPQFNKELEDIKKIRYSIGKDKKPLSTRRITKGITKHSLWPTYKKELIDAEFKDE